MAPDNLQAAGQTIPITPVSSANTLAFLGLATYGPSSGTAMLTYTDGTTQPFTLDFAERKQHVNTYIFYPSIALTSGKTVQSVALPTSVNQGHLHIFAVGLK